jgi:uncharacterized membrane protein
MSLLHGGAEGRGRLVHVLFEVGVLLKGIDGVLEIVGGVLLLVVDPNQLYHVVRLLTQHELSEDPHDLIATYLLHTAGHLSASTELFGALYLLWHGLVKAGLVAALLLRRRWAYPAAMIAFALFVLYQLYRYSNTHSFGLLLLSAVDVFVIALTWLEYQRLRSSHAFL